MGMHCFRQIMPNQSKWLWDEDYGMKSNVKDEHEEDQCEASCK
jgi:hypothetical protein